MINETETKLKFGYTSNDIGHFSKHILIYSCDVCHSILEKESIKIFMARKNSKSEIDVCSNIECIKKKRENTMLKEYGVVNAGLSSEIRNRVENTCLERYGTKHPMKNIELQKQSKIGCLKKYGVENPFQSNIIKNKIKSNNFEKYGVEYTSQLESTKEKIKETCIERYGVEHPMSCKDISDKTSKTWNEIIYNRMCNNTEIKPLFSKDVFVGFKNKDSYLFECRICGNKFENNYMGVVCYKCHPQPRSKPESDLSEFLKSIYTGEIKSNVRKPFNNEFEVDFYFPEENLAIELNGNYYHSELLGLKNKNYHVNKTDFCEEKGIHLIQIFEDEWVEKKEIIKNKLKHILNINDNKRIFARNCEVKIINNTECESFLKENHIQGNSVSSIKLGLYDNGTLISVMTLSHPRLNMGNKLNKLDEYELNRYSSNCIVVGGAGKLLSHFIKIYKPKKIISYADRRWTYYKSNLYEKIGFKKVSDGAPNYWYMNKKKYLHRFHRFSFRKNVLSKKLQSFDSNLTEWENMQLNGYDRIWDCGSLKYQMDC